LKVDLRVEGLNYSCNFGSFYGLPTALLQLEVGSLDVLEYDMSGSDIVELRGASTSTFLGLTILKAMHIPEPVLIIHDANALDLK